MNKLHLILQDGASKLDRVSDITQNDMLQVGIVPFSMKSVLLLGVDERYLSDSHWELLGT